MCLLAQTEACAAVAASCVGVCAACRYFLCSAWWQPGGPIFMYAGNEADVELYVNATGLM